MSDATFKVFRGNAEHGELIEYRVPIAPGMVVLDALHYIQAHQAPDLAVRWNCKAGKCGSCSAEVNGRPRLTCKTRMDELPQDEPITVQPMKSFPVIKDLVTDVSWNYRVNKKIPPFTPRADVEPKNQAAQRLLGLAITDQFTGHPSDRHVEAKSIFQRLTDRYEQLYYTGL